MSINEQRTEAVARLRARRDYLHGVINSIDMMLEVIQITPALVDDRLLNLILELYPVVEGSDGTVER